jgi:hypothetical protein
MEMRHGPRNLRRPAAAAAAGIKSHAVCRQSILGKNPEIGFGEQFALVRR